MRTEKTIRKRLEKRKDSKYAKYYREEIRILEWVLCIEPIKALREELER